MPEIPKPSPPRACNGGTPVTEELGMVRGTLNKIREAMFTVGVDPQQAYEDVRQILASNWEHADVPGRAFDLIRYQDESKVSGTGRVAEGFEFEDGTVALRWRGPRSSTNVYQSVEDVSAIHGHGGSTRVVYR